MNHSGPAGASAHVRRADHPQHAVGADAEPAVAQRGDQVGGEVERAVGVGQDDEVVARPVAL